MRATATGWSGSLLNTILGALDPDDDGGYYYYSDYQAGARSVTTSASGLAARVPSCNRWPTIRWIFTSTNRGIYVNLYAGSEVRWSAAGPGDGGAEHRISGI